MNISLPIHFEYSSLQYNHNFARIKNGKLIISGNVDFKNLMSNISYCLKGNRCFYCKVKLTKTSRTIDHLIPRELGGPSIPDNLVPSCKKCNSEKSNMLPDIYKHYQEIHKKSEKNQFYKDYIKSTKSQNSFLPENWVQNICVSKIKIPKSLRLDNLPVTKKDEMIKDYYLKTNSFKKPILVDCNNCILDGVKILKFAIENGISLVPAIVLENVLTES